MKSTLTSKTHRPYLMAVVLGTALAAMGPESVANADAISPRAITNVSRYCTACWRNARVPQDQWGDCTQEVFTRLLRTVPAKSWERMFANETEERREFIRAIDAVKKRHQRGRWQSAVLPELVADSRGQLAHERNEDRAAVNEAAQRVLSVRQQRILQLLCDGHNVSDIAAELSMTPERVSDEKYKAIQKLRSHFQA
ncbi:MAG: sigma-70 family RNA polymerase sigma factor [Planctomycetes bacterium]|nr:sigma-70 family RNA polymerase sigma factor [Planctomycetota bacterium]